MKYGKPCLWAQENELTKIFAAKHNPVHIAQRSFSMYYIVIHNLSLCNEFMLTE